MIAAGWGPERCVRARRLLALVVLGLTFGAWGGGGARWDVRGGSSGGTPGSAAGDRVAASPSARSQQATGRGPVVAWERGGEVAALASLGSYAVVGVGRRLKVFEAGGTSGAPIGTSAPLLLPVQAIDVLDRVAAVVGGRPGSPAALTLFDLSDPTLPKRLGRVPLPRFARSVALERRSGGALWAWVPQGPVGLVAYDWSDPARPRQRARWRPPAGGTHAAEDVLPLGSGVAAIVAERGGAEGEARLAEVLRLRADDTGAVAVLDRRAFRGPVEAWFVLPGHVASVERSWLRVMAVGAEGSLADRASVRRRTAEFVGLGAVGDRLVVAYATGTDKEMLELDVHALEDGRELGSGRVAEIAASSWRVAGGWGDRLLVGGWDALHRVALGSRPAHEHRWIASRGRYLDAQPYAEGWLALTEAGDLQRLDGEGALLEEGLVDAPLDRIVVSGRRLLGMGRESRRFHVLGEVQGPSGRRWTLGEPVPWPRFERPPLERVAASEAVVAAWTMHGNGFGAGHWADQRLERHQDAVRHRTLIPPPAFVVLGDELWFTGGARLLEGYRWRSGVAPEHLTANALTLSTSFLGGSLAGRGRRFLVGDTVLPLLLALDYLPPVGNRSPIGTAVWQVDLPGVATNVALGERVAWAAWAAPRPGLAAIRDGGDVAEIVGEVPLSGTPRSMVDRDDQLWVAQADGALSRYETGRGGPVRTAEPTARATPVATRTPTALPIRPTATGTAGSRRTGVSLWLPWVGVP